MRFHPDEFSPDRDLAWKVVSDHLQQSILRYEKEAGRAICVTLLLSHGPRDDRVGSFSGEFSPDTTNEPIGEVRLRFRRTVRTDRVLYCAETFFKPNSVVPGSGFSGFRCSGEVLGEWPEVIVRARGGYTNIHNDFSPSGWFW